MKEFILCASVMYQGNIISGRRHSDCYEILENLLGKDIDLGTREDQGFLTSKGRHVSRREAFVIAKENGQIFHNMYDNVDVNSEQAILTSEDLYYDTEIDDN
jgi:hypothetical protein